MAKGLNKVMLIGNLGRDAELRYTPTGRPITSFSVVVQREGVALEGTVDWFTVVAWDGLAEACNRSLGNGKPVYVEGRLQTRGFQKDGRKHYRSEVIADVVVPLEDVSAPPEPQEESEAISEAQLSEASPAGREEELAEAPAKGEAPVVEDEKDGPASSQEPEGPEDN